MKNQVHGSASLYLLQDTEMDEESFQTKFHQENIVGIKLYITTSDGTIHEVDAAYLEELNWTEYIEKATEQTPSDPKE